jgi:hypothetical protein
MFDVHFLRMRFLTPSSVGFEMTPARPFKPIHFYLQVVNMGMFFAGMNPTNTYSQPNGKAGTAGPNRAWHHCTDTL